jgi:hypothetical protein
MYERIAVRRILRSRGRRRRKKRNAGLWTVTRSC